MKILVCVDGSPKSMKAVVKAVDISTGCRVDKVTLISVCENNLMPPVVEYGSRDDIHKNVEGYELATQRIREHCQKYLEHAAMRFREKGIEPALLLKEGHPAHTIAETADEGQFDMIIMGSRGNGGLKKLLLGSVSNAVIQETAASVLVVK